MATRRTVEVAPGDDLPSLAQDVLGSQLAEARAHVAGSIKGTDPEELHDLRVAVRRTRAALRLFERALPAAGAALGPARSGMKETGAVLGRARDLDVQVGRLLDWLATSHRSSEPSAGRAVRLLQEERAVARRALRRHLRGPVFEARLQAVGSAAEAAGQAPIRRGPVRLLRRPSKQVLLAIERARARPFDPVTFHALRIDIKRLRYALEFLAPSLPFPVEKAIRGLRGAQDALGKLQDAAVEQAVAQRLIGRARGDEEVCGLLDTYRQAQATAQEAQLAACAAMLDDLAGDVLTLRGRLNVH